MAVLYLIEQNRTHLGKIKPSRPAKSSSELPAMSAAKHDQGLAEVRERIPQEARRPQTHIFLLESLCERQVNSLQGYNYHGTSVLSSASVQRHPTQADSTALLLH